MASFRTHLTAGCLVSGVGATGLLVADVAGAREVALYLALGGAGSVLPDLDSDRSLPVRVAFNALAVVAAFLAMFELAAGRTLAELLAVWLVVFAVVKYVAYPSFARLTAHRGLFHSLPAAAVAGLATTVGLDRLAGWGSERAWLGGLFVAGGFLLHLTLDELTSLNLFGSYVRSSFGSALKPFDRRRPVLTGMLYALAFALVVSAPPVGPLVEALEDGRSLLQVSLWPRSGEAWLPF